jgi:Sigma-70 region 2
MIGQARPEGTRRDTPPREQRRRPVSPGSGLMQRPTEPTAATAPPQRPTPRGDEGELYRRHHRDLHRTVARAVNGSRELIEDACQTAWLILLRRQPDRERVFGWLRTVAIHEAYRLIAEGLSNTAIGERMFLSPKTVEAHISRSS